MASSASASTEASLWTPVRYVTSYCPSGVLEVQRWNRSKREWWAHPDHPRILANSCELEESGGLLNETRFRCLKRRSEHAYHAWRLVRVFENSWMETCPELKESAEGGPLGVRLDQPLPGATVSNLDESVDVSGQVELSLSPFSGRDIVFALDIAPSARHLGYRLARSLIPQLRTRTKSLRIGFIYFSSLAESGGESTSPIELVSADRALSLAAPLFRGDTVEALSHALRSWKGKAGSEGGGRLPRHRTVVLVVGAGASRPFGRGVGRDPVYRERLTRLLRQTRERGAALHVVVVARPNQQQTEFARLLSFEQAGAFFWLQSRSAEQAAEKQLVEYILPEVKELEVRNLDSELETSGLQLRSLGRFRATVPLRVGSNRIEVRAQVSADRTAAGEFELFYDPTAAKQAWLERERERIEAERRGRKRIILSVDEEVDEPPSD